MHMYVRSDRQTGRQTDTRRSRKALFAAFTNAPNKDLELLTLIQSKWVCKQIVLLE